MTSQTRRAAPMPAEDRRRAIIDAVVPLLVSQGADVTTRQIADAAGVAEGTIFRVFASKDELVEAAVRQAFVPGRFVHDLDAVDPTTPLRKRLVQVVTILQRRFTEIFGLMRAVGMVAPPDHDSEAHLRAREEVNDRLVRLVQPDADRLTMSPAELMHVLRLLTFSASHHEIADGRPLTPTQIVDVVLDGVLVKERPC
jgi:AcrR family transcriptional regulator